MEERQLPKSIGDEVYIELIHSVKDIITLLIEKLWSQTRTEG